MIIMEIADYLNAHGVGIYDDSGTTGNIFIDNMPDEPDIAIGLYSSSGMAPDIKTKLRRPGVQIIVRGDRDPLTSATLAQQVYNALHATDAKTFTDGGTEILLCAARQEPIRLGPDDNGRYEYSLNFQLITGGS